MLDHLAIGVRDLAASRAFYEAALAPLGFGVVMESDDRVAFGPPARPIFCLVDGEPAGGIHIAFQAADRESVDAFHAAGLAAGGDDNGGPGIRPKYHPHYYAAFILRPGRQQRRSRLPHARNEHARIPSPPSEATPGDRLPPGQYLERGFPVLSGRTHARHAARRVDVHPRRRGRRRAQLDLGGVPGAAEGDADRRHPLRDDVVEVRHQLGGRLGRHAARRRSSRSAASSPRSPTAGTRPTSRSRTSPAARAWVVYGYDGDDLEPEHGGPARLLVPHLYSLEEREVGARPAVFMEEDELGFWETLGYHDRGDPWLEQRYQGD